MLTQNYYNPTRLDYGAGYLLPPTYYPLTPPYNYSYDYPTYINWSPSSSPESSSTQSSESDCGQYSTVQYKNYLPPLISQSSSVYYPQYPTPPLSQSPEQIRLDQTTDNLRLNEQRTVSVIMKVETNKVNNLQVNVRKDEKEKSSSESESEEIICKWENCYRLFKSLEELAAHVTHMHAVASMGGLYYCRWENCLRSDRGFNARYKMLVHVRTHTKEKPHQCLQCEKSFSRAENLKIHTRSHSGEKPYICPVEGCNKAYSNSSDRFKHTRTHSMEKPYYCKVVGCNKRYTDPSSLRKHVKTFKHIKLEEPVIISTDDTDKCDQSPHSSSVPYIEYNQTVTPRQIELCNPSISDCYNPTENHSNNIDNDLIDNYHYQHNRDSLEKFQRIDMYKLGHLFNDVNLDVSPTIYRNDEPCCYSTTYWIDNSNHINDLKHEQMDMDLPLDLSLRHCER